jgi:hypothetical protein
MEKQAVVLIHGIGEQLPMESLRRFVQTVWSTDTNVHRQGGQATEFWSKPYPLSQNFELRRLTTAENKAGIRTDFFELYWAHLMHGTKLRHVLTWTKTLLWRWPWTVPAHLHLVYGVLLALLAFGTFMVYQATSAQKSGTALFPAWVPWTLAASVVPAIYGVLERVVGDAARYLHPAPENVQRRHEIRAAGVEVLKALHEPKRGYKRIIVVGHSLGSVIGYDVLYHAWAEYNADKPTTVPAKYEALTDLEHLVAGAETSNSLDVSAFRRAQRRYLKELTDNGARWRVTDFVTLGSPLAHAEILLARDAHDLESKFKDRELPKCPPVLEREIHGGKELRRFSYPVEKPERTPHHAAVFGPTRWTNLYFPCWFIVWGDMIGGPLRRIFGAGVSDYKISTSLRLGFLSHTLYWTRDGRKNQHVRKLREALDLADERD